MTAEAMSYSTRKARWLALVAALLGWMFDGMEMGLFPLVAKSALAELMGASKGDANVNRWFGVIIAMFLVGAATGGVLFGWLGDRIGRVRAMTVSVLVYSLCSGLSAASQEVWHLAVLRFIGALGMGGEWALGVALVMELWPNSSRAWLAGWIGAFGNLGYTLIGSIAYTLLQFGGEIPRFLVQIGCPESWALSLTANGNWRLLMLIGAVPALSTLLLRLFVPESEKWQAEKKTGRVSNWSTRDLIGVLIGAIAATVMIYVWATDTTQWGDFGFDHTMTLRIFVSIACLIVVTAGYTYPVRCYLRRVGLPAQERRRTLKTMLLAAGLSGVPLLATWSGVMWMYKWVGSASFPAPPEAIPLMQISSSLGAAIGCVLGAVLGGRYGRRIVYAILCILSFLVMVGFYKLNTQYGTILIFSAGLMGMTTASFYGWLPLYLPELFRTSVRATGQGFAFNFGRIIAAVGNLQMANLLLLFGNDYGNACAVVGGVYLVGLILICFAPETKGKPLPD